jgi:hypothetical protein
MLRVPPDELAALLAREHTRPMEMRGREMNGWIRVDPEGCASDEALAEWVRRGLEQARVVD